MEVDVPNAPETRLPRKLRAKSVEWLRERRDHLRDTDTELDAHSPAVSDTGSRGRKRSEESYLGASCMVCRIFCDARDEL